MTRCAVLLGLLLLGSSAGVVPAGAEEAGKATQPYLDSTTVDLTVLLPPPPAADSAEERGELGDLLVLQVTRTPEMVARAQADAVEEVWRFADVLGPKFTAETLPRTAALFARLLATDNAVLEPAKMSFGRPRPYMVSDLIHPVVKPTTTGSWPSSHAAVGTLMGIVLGDMLPEKRAALMERGRIYADNRLVAGAHFPSDVAAGRIAGTVVAAAVLRQPDFQADLAAARAELRAALGLS